MGDAKLHYGNRLRLDVRYPGKPDRGQPEPLPGTPVHLYTANLFKVCRKPKSGLEMGTHDANKVTCPHCLKLMNAHAKQPPCGSPVRSATLSVDPAHERGKPGHHHANSSFGGSPASVSADAGFLFGSE